MRDRLDEVRQRLGKDTAALVVTLGAEETIDTLMGAALTVLVAHRGPALASRYLRGLADLVEREEMPPASLN